MKYIIILVLAIVLIYLTKYNVENFAIPIINPYSLYLHKDITRRAELWRLCHSKKLYYYDNVTPQHFKE